MEDGNRHDLIAALVLEAGRIIEDLTPTMAERLPDSFEARSRLLNDIAQQHQSVRALMQAALALNGDGSPGTP